MLSICLSVNSMIIIVGGRSSPLSQAQIQEVWTELCQHHPHIVFQKVLINTVGDKDKKTSLRTLGKTDFFTKEVDELLLEKKCRIAIHSAKDLPEPIPKGIMLVALTKGLDSADSLVLRHGETLQSLKNGACIATSSERREEAVKSMRKDLIFNDLRGTIHERLSHLDSGKADGVVIAEAALIRLKLTHLNRIKLPGTTVPYQGQLAIMALDDDKEMQTIFACIDTSCRKMEI